MSEENKALYRKFVDEVVNKKNLGMIDEMMTPDYIEHDEMPPGMPSGAEGMKAMLGMMFSAFPDMQFTTEDLIAEGDMVVGRHRTTGTHSGEFIGIPATGKRIDIQEVHFVRFANGKGVEHRGSVDQMAMMQQLGVIPAPGQ